MGKAEKCLGERRVTQHGENRGWEGVGQQEV